MGCLDMGPVNEDLSFARKDSFVFEFICIEETTGVPINFTGTIVVMTINPKKDGSQPDLFTLVPINVLDNTGLLQFKATTVQNDLDEGDYYYDIEWTFGSGVRTIICGMYSIMSHISN